MGLFMGAFGLSSGNEYGPLTDQTEKELDS